MTLTVISKHSRTIQKLVKEQMKQEIEELGFDPYGDGAQDEYERRVMDLEQESLKTQTSIGILNMRNCPPTISFNFPILQSK